MGSRTGVLPKKSRTGGQADGRLRDGRLDGDKALARQPVRPFRRGPIPEPARGGGECPAGILKSWVTAMSEVTRILSAIEQGDPHAAGELLPIVYDELRQLAAQKLAQERPGQTLQATALVHEAY